MNWTIKSISVGLLSLLVHNTASAVPKTVTEPLPLENPVMQKLGETVEGKKALSFILSLSTYQDNEDPSKFYYAPTFRASTNPAGAATVVTNDKAVDRRSGIDSISAELSALKTEDFLTIRNAYKKLTDKLGDSRLTQTERNAINEARAQLKLELDRLVARASANEGELPAYVINAKLERMADLFGQSGFSLSMDALKDVSQRTKTLGDLSGSNGGIFSGNIFSGLTPEQIEHVRFYKQVRADLGFGQVKVAVLPVENISFFSLAETYTDSANKASVGIPLFRSMAGSGNLAGATYNFDLTLDGAEKFSSAPPPIYVPIGVRAKLTVNPPQFTAKLSCDFTTGWSVKGRTDVKDGLIIYNNDVYTTMVAEDISQTNKPCRLEVNGGTGSTREYAYAEALRTLQGRLENLFFTRSDMAARDKMAYWQGVQTDIQNNRHNGANEGWSSLFTNATGLGFVGTLFGGFANASRFYWHTNIQNVTALSKVKFEEEIVINQNEKIDYPLATTDMCLAWNPGKKRYLACSPDEALQAQTVNDAAQEAQETCQTGQTASACANDRNDNAPQNENGNIESGQTPAPNPGSLPDEI